MDTLVVYKLNHCENQLFVLTTEMITLVAAKLKRQWLCIVQFANYIRQPQRKLLRHHKSIKCSCSDSLTDVRQL